jgi:hypothetical protein
MGGLLEPCNILPGNCSAHGVNNSKRSGKCAFRLKKSAVVRKLLHHKVGKVPKNGWWGGGGVRMQPLACIIARGSTDTVTQAS